MPKKYTENIQHQSFLFPDFEKRNMERYCIKLKKKQLKKNNFKKKTIKTKCFQMQYDLLEYEPYIQSIQTKYKNF